jgi:hypothetical protein
MQQLDSIRTRGFKFRSKRANKWTVPPLKRSDDDPSLPWERNQRRRKTDSNSTASSQKKHLKGQNKQSTPKRNSSNHKEKEGWCDGVRLGSLCDV